MDSHRKYWNEQQQALRKALLAPGEYARALDLFLQQHAMLHSAAVSGFALHSFEDELWSDLTEAKFRCIPPGEEHSIAWAIWHITRIEDITMNLLLAGQPQLLQGEGWGDRLNTTARDTGNAMSPVEITRLSSEIDFEALRAYRMAVGRTTRRVVASLQASDFKLKVEPARLQRCLDEAAVVEAACWLLNYWGGLTIAGLLLMPPTRHNFIHINEALRLKKKKIKVLE
jgi:hypothetical protein